jgi:hypothetical protein
MAGAQSSMSEIACCRPDSSCLIASAMVLDVDPTGSSRDRSQHLEPLVLARF